MLLINTPVILIAGLFLSGKDERTALIFLFLVISVHSTVLQVMSVEPSIRHHHATAIPLVIGLSLIAGRFSRKPGKA
jgi:uncharacterized membrane protein